MPHPASPYAPLWGRSRPDLHEDSTVSSPPQWLGENHPCMPAPSAEDGRCSGGAGEALHSLISPPGFQAQSVETSAVARSTCGNRWRHSWVTQHAAAAPGCTVPKVGAAHAQVRQRRLLLAGPCAPGLPAAEGHSARASAAARICRLTPNAGGCSCSHRLHRRAC
jgi:hypothetical protein